MGGKGFRRFAGKKPSTGERQTLNALRRGIVPSAPSAFPLWRCSACDRTYTAPELAKWVKTSGSEFSSMRVRHTFCSRTPAGILQRDPFVAPKAWGNPVWEKDVTGRGIEIPDLKALGYSCEAEFYFVLGCGGPQAIAMHAGGSPKWAIVMATDALRLQWQAGGIASIGCDELLKVPDFIMGADPNLESFKARMAERAQEAKE